MRTLSNSLRLACRTILVSKNKHLCVPPYLGYSIYKTYADLRPTNCLVFVYIRQVRRHGLSFEERPLTSGPGEVSTLLTRPAAFAVTALFSRRIDYLQLSPAIQNYYSSSNNLLIQSLCDWATYTLTLPYSRITTTSTQTPLLVFPRFVTVTS